MFWTLYLGDYLSSFCLVFFSWSFFLFFHLGHFLCLLILAASLCLFLCIFLILTRGYVSVDFRERGSEREREKHQCETETSISCLLYICQLGFKPATFWCTFWWCSDDLSTEIPDRGCFYVLSRATPSPRLGKVGFLSRCPVGPVAQPSCLSKLGTRGVPPCGLYTPSHCSWDFIVVGTSMGEFYPQADWLQRLAATTLEDQLCRGQLHGTGHRTYFNRSLVPTKSALWVWPLVEMVRRCFYMAWNCPLGVLVLGHPRRYRSRSATTCALPRTIWHKLQSYL